jgi:hypothetical protein
MIEINSIKTEDLQDENRFSEFQAAAFEAVETGRAQDALDFRILIQRFFEEYKDLEYSKPELFKNYRKIILYIELEEFEFIPENLQVMLLEKYLYAFEQLKLDVGQKVDMALLLEDEVLRDGKRDTLMAALLQNQQRIGTEQIELQGNMVSPTVGNWAQKYRIQFGQKHKDEIVRMDFCERDEARTLSDRDKKKLRMLVDLVEELKIEPEKEEYETDEVGEPSKVTPAFSSLYVPTKKPKVPFSDMQKPQGSRAFSGMAPQAQQSASSLRPQFVQTASLAPQAAQEPEDQVTSTNEAPVFHSLADLNILNLPMIEAFGEQLPHFVETVKGEIQKVYARSPESKPHIVDLWRQSPLYNLYAEMSEESMQARKPISEIAKDRTQNGHPTLTKEQFDLVADLSKMIQ